MSNERRADGKNGKIVSIERAKKIAGNLRKRKKKIVFTNGCFDVLHIGHVRTFKFCRRFGDAVIVGLNSDRSVRKLKGAARPFIPQKERAEILSALSDVDYVVVFDTDTPLPLIRALKPDVHVKGGDYEDVRTLPEYKIVTSYGGEVVLAPLVKGRSTTKLADYMKSVK